MTPKLVQPVRYGPTVRIDRLSQSGFAGTHEDEVC